MIDIFINTIFLYDDKMMITFSYKEGTTTIIFADLNAALPTQKTGSDLDCSTALKVSVLQTGSCGAGAFFTYLNYFQELSVREWGCFAADFEYDC